MPKSLLTSAHCFALLSVTQEIVSSVGINVLAVQNFIRVLFIDTLRMPGSGGTLAYQIKEQHL